MKNQRNVGKVYLVGAGPGDPGLLTLRGYEVLRICDVVIYDALINTELLGFTPPDTERIFIGQPRQKNRIKQEEVQRIMISRAGQGKVVARLKGGDPFVFGRGGEEAAALARAGVEWEVVPGVSSGHAVPAYAGIPLTHRDISSSVAFVTGHEQKEKSFSVDWNALAKAADTLVIFMGSENLRNIVAALTKAGRPASTPIAVIECGTTPQQCVYTATLGTILNQVAEGKIKTPALTIVGNVVQLHEKLSWDPPLHQLLAPTEGNGERA